MSRTEAREYAFKILYQMDIHKEDETEILKVFFEENSPDEKQREYIETIVIQTHKNIDKINDLIEKSSIDWKINRISKVILAILRLAIFEMINMEDIPIEVSLNEAIELAKKYDSEKAGSFVNGLLGSIKKQLSL